jgi:hypothetical protein
LGTVGCSTVGMCAGVLFIAGKLPGCFFHRLYPFLVEGQGTESSLLTATYCSRTAKIM